MVSEGIKDLTNKGFTNNFSSRWSTIMFDLSKSFPQLCLAICGEKIIFSLLYKHLKKVRKRKKITKKSSKSFPLFLSCKIKLDFFYLPFQATKNLC